MKRLLIAVAAVVAGVGLSLVVAQPASATGNSNEGSGSTVVGFDYVDANYGGAVLTSWRSGGNCTGSISDVDVQFSSFPSGWNDVISSEASAAVCWQKLWENSGFWGSSWGYYGTQSYVGGAMNDRASSVQFS